MNSMTHVFKSECLDVDGLFEGCSTFDAYMQKLAAQAPAALTADYIKHGFGALVEAIILSERRTMRIKDYQLLPTCQVAIDNDGAENGGFGVDGLGKKSSGKKVAVMACYVEDPTTLLTANGNHLTTFRSNAFEKYGIDKNEPKALRIFSNAAGLNENTEDQYFAGNLTTFYFKSDIETIINGNNKFWIRIKNWMKSKDNANIRGPLILRPFQKKGSNKIFENSIGQVILPTGTGKSLIAIDAIHREIEKAKAEGDNTPVILIMTPRIVLTYQLLGETISYMKSKRQDAQYFNLNSGKFDDDSIKRAMASEGLPVRDVPSGTKSKDVRKSYLQAVKNGVPFIISSTYQSAPRLLHVKIEVMVEGKKGKMIKAKQNLPIRMAVHDEAHNLVEGIGRFSTGDKIDVLKLIADKKIFLTATPAWSKSDEVTGMNNVLEYGEELFRCSPKEMIEAGEIVPPYIHQVIVDEYKMKDKIVKLTKGELIGDDLERNGEFMAVVIEESFNEHLKLVKQYSCAPDKIGAKLLVICRGDDTFQGFFNSSAFEAMRLNRKDIKFFGISSRYGAWIDGDRVRIAGGWYKEQFMMALRNLKPTDNAVILHIDMLGEGIDVPGMTGVLPFRDLGDIKSCQTLGRAMRLVTDDRNSFYSGEREARDTSKMIKPLAWVVIPVYSSNHEEIKAKVIEIAQNIRDTMGYSPFEWGHAATGGAAKVIGPEGVDHGIPMEGNFTHIIENPYFVALTNPLIHGSINGHEDKDFFEIVRKYIK